MFAALSTTGMPGSGSAICELLEVLGVAGADVSGSTGLLLRGVADRTADGSGGVDLAFGVADVVVSRRSRTW